MKRQIRRNCFETNSSSSHSIVVTKNNDVHVTQEELLDGSEYMYIGRDGSWELSSNANDMCFDRWPFQILATFHDKFKYAVASFGFTDELNDILHKVAPSIKEIDLPEETVDVFIDEDGNEYGYGQIKYEDRKPFVIKDGEKIQVKKDLIFKPFLGEIDHQSMGLLDQFLKKYNVSLEEFLTNKKYKIIIDGDEYCFWQNAKYSGLVDEDNIEIEYS